MNKQQALQKIEELKAFVSQCDENNEFIKIDYSVAPKELFDKYGIKPFEVAKTKFRENGKTVNNITFEDSKKKAKENGCRLMNINEHLFLLELYKNKYPDNASIHHKEFLGIEELSYDEDVCYEWIDSKSVIPFLRGGNWSNGSAAGVFAAGVSWPGSTSYYYVGFRCAR